MSVTFRLISFLSAWVIIANSSLFAEDEPPKIEWLTDVPAAAKRAAAEGKPILARFGADWCTYCKKMDHYAFDDDDIAAKINEHFIPLYIDADLHPGMLARMQVKSLPSFVVLSPLMNIVDRSSGYKKEKEFLAFIEPHCKLREIAMQRTQNSTPPVEQVQAHRFEVKNMLELQPSTSTKNLQPSATTSITVPQTQQKFESIPTLDKNPVESNTLAKQSSETNPFSAEPTFAPPAFDNHINNFNPMQKTVTLPPEKKTLVDPKATVSIPSLPPPLQLENPSMSSMAESRPTMPQPKLEDAPVWGQPQVNNSPSRKPEAIDSLPPMNVGGVAKLTENKSPFALPELSESSGSKTYRGTPESSANPWATQDKPTQSVAMNTNTPMPSVPTSYTNPPSESVMPKPATTIAAVKPLAFNGVCLVSVLEEGKLQNGLEKYQTSYQGFTVYFSSQKFLDLFLSNPARYWPANNGVCPVSAMDKQLALLGQPVFAVRYQGRTHFCADRETAMEFLSNPKRYHEYITK